MTDSIQTDATLPNVPAKDVKEAQLDGVKEAIADGAKQRFLSTDGVEVNDAEPGITPTYNVFHLQHLVDLDPKDLRAKLDGKDGETLSEGQIAALLEVERSGKNRTDVVKVLCDRLGIKTPYEVTDAGPNYTNDVNRTVVAPRAG